MKNHEISATLKMRAFVMAKEPKVQRDASLLLEVIEFTLASEKYCVPSRYVREVYPLKEFTPLPGVPSYILGIVNIRGQILPLVDLKKFFNFPLKGIGELNKVIVIQDDRMEFGILADEVIGTNAIYKDDILPVPHTVSGIGEKYLEGVTKEQLIILDFEALLSDKNIFVNDQVNL